MAKKKSKKQTAESAEVARRKLRAKQARLQAQLEALKQELGDEEDEGEDEGEDEDGDESDDAGHGLVVKSGAGGIQLPQDMQNMLGQLASGLMTTAQFTHQLNNLFVTQETPRDAHGGPGFGFQRQAFRVKGIKFDGRGAPQLDLEVLDFPGPQNF